MTTFVTSRNFAVIERITGDVWIRNYVSIPETARIVSISFRPSAANDRLVIKNGGAAGPDVLDWTAAAVTSERTRYFFGERAIFNPFIDFSECVFAGGGHKVMIEFEC